MASPKGPKFYFELDGLRYGARNLTIGEQASCLAKIEQLSNGNHREWKNDETAQYVAFNLQAAVYLNIVICQWPTGVEPIDFLDADDTEILGRYWEAYVKASEDFRKGRDGKGASPGMGTTASAPEMVPGQIPSVATR